MVCEDTATLSFCTQKKNDGKCVKSSIAKQCRLTCDNCQAGHENACDPTNPNACPSTQSCLDDDGDGHFECECKEKFHVADNRGRCKLSKL